MSFLSFLGGVADGYNADVKRDAALEAERQKLLIAASISNMSKSRDAKTFTYTDNKTGDSITLPTINNIPTKLTEKKVFANSVIDFAKDDPGKLARLDNFIVQMNKDPNNPYEYPSNYASNLLTRQTILGTLGETHDENGKLLPQPDYGYLQNTQSFSGLHDEIQSRSLGGRDITIYPEAKANPIKGKITPKNEFITNSDPNYDSIDGEEITVSPSLFVSPDGRNNREAYESLRETKNTQGTILDSNLANSLVVSDMFNSINSNDITQAGTIRKRFNRYFKNTTEVEMYDPVLGSNRKVIRPTGFDIIDFKENISNMIHDPSIESRGGKFIGLSGSAFNNSEEGQKLINKDQELLGSYNEILKSGLAYVKILKEAIEDPNISDNDTAINPSGFIGTITDALNTVLGQEGYVNQFKTLSKQLSGLKNNLSSERFGGAFSGNEEKGKLTKDQTVFGLDARGRLKKGWGVQEEVSAAVDALATTANARKRLQALEIIIGYKAALVMQGGKSESARISNEDFIKGVEASVGTGNITQRMQTVLDFLKRRIEETAAIELTNSVKGYNYFANKPKVETYIREYANRGHDIYNDERVEKTTNPYYLSDVLFLFNDRLGTEMLDIENYLNRGRFEKIFRADIEKPEPELNPDPNFDPRKGLRGGKS